jgi:muramidase (phage lysozyme)
MNRVTRKIISGTLVAASYLSGGGAVFGQSAPQKSAVAASTGRMPGAHSLHPDMFLELENPTSRHDLPAEARAFLDAVAYAEGTDGPDGYTKVFTRKNFKQDVTKPGAVHPGQVYCSGKKLCSSAAGRYQILKVKVDELKLKGFTRWFQDTMAVRLVQRRGAWKDVLAGRFKEAFWKCRHEWASIEGNNYNQPTHKIDKLVAYANRRLEGYREAKAKYEAALRGEIPAPIVKAVAARAAKQPPVIEAAAKAQTETVLRSSFKVQRNKRVDDRGKTARYAMAKIKTGPAR